MADDPVFGDADDLTQIAQMLVAGQTVASAIVRRGRSYSLLHLGHDGAGTPNLKSIYFAFDVAVVTATQAAGVNKLELQDGTAIPLPPGIGTISYKTASGDGNVAFEIIASAPLLGEF